MEQLQIVAKGYFMKRIQALISINGR